VIRIRPERAGDVAAVHAVHCEAFPNDDEARLVARLREGGRATVSLVAEVGGKVVGHVVFSPVTIATESGLRSGLGLAPLAVLPAHQRLGIGSALAREGVEVSRRQGVGFVVVLGHPEYYPRFGFRRASELGLRNEYGADEAFMALELQAGALPPAGGLVKYGPEFGEWEKSQE
jgi:putative acetyltransferase